MTAAQVGQIPHALDAESALLGSMLLSPSAVRMAADVLGPEDFYRTEHRAIFLAVLALTERGAAIDPTTVTEQLRHAGMLEMVGGRSAVLAIQAGTPASGNAVHYAEVVARAGACRRALTVSADVRDRAMAGDLEGVESVLEGAEERLAAPLGMVEPGVDLTEVLAREAEPTEWLIPDCLGRRERVMITGEEGRGKSTLIRQLGIQVACGVHPWRITAIDRVRVLHVDMENSPEQSRREYVRIAKQAVRSKYEKGWLAVKYRPQGLDLTRRADVRWLEALLSVHRPDLLTIGPLYKMMRGTDRRSIHSEESAAEVAFALDLIRARYDCALMIEAHSPHIAQNAKKRDLRPIGASLWLRWPETGMGLSAGPEQSAKLEKWRLDRVRGRQWPKVLEAGGPMWPWTVPEEIF